MSVCDYHQDVTRRRLFPAIMAAMLAMTATTVLNFQESADGALTRIAQSHPFTPNAKPRTNGPRAYRWPITTTGALLTWSSNPKPIKFGTPVTARELGTSPNLSDSITTSIASEDGYALGDINGFQYPLFTSNHGTNWAIAGPYFSGPWADAGAGAFQVHIVNSQVALAYGNQWIYDTTDGGRHWYVADIFDSVWGTGIVKESGAIELVTDAVQSGQKNYYSIVASAQYRSSDGGRTWKLVQRPESWPTSAAGSLLTSGTYDKPMKIGTPVDKANLDGNSLASKSLVGRYGFALGTLDQFQYPVRTVNNGATWEVAGVWFAGPWADAPAFAIQIKAYSSLVAVATNDNWFYVTNNGGQTWYRIDVYGSPRNCWQLVPKSPTPALLDCEFSAPSPSHALGNYLSYDGGLHWSVVS
jgi:hypothetical protein